MHEMWVGNGVVMGFGWGGVREGASVPHAGTAS